MGESHLVDVYPPSLNGNFRGKEGKIRKFSNGGDDRIRSNLKIGSFDGDRPPPSSLIGITQPHLNTGYPCGSLPIAGNLCGGGEKMDLNAFVEGLFHFVREGGHLLSRTAIEDLHR